MYENEPKWGESQAGRPRPGQPAYPCYISSCNFVEHGLSTRSSSHQCGSGRIHKSRSKGLNQVELSPNPMTTRRFRTQLNLRSNVPERRRPEPSQSQASRPRRNRPASNSLRWSHATATDFRRRSRASTQRRRLDGRIPRTAGLGEASRPHLAASDVLPWHERQAQLPYQRATNAQLTTDHRVV